MSFGSVRPEVWLATGYAGLLLAVAASLEALARHTAVRSERYRTAGFRYQPQHDLWLCPENEPLWPHEVDRERRLVRYRARAVVCNACPSKGVCTDSSEGREILRPVDPWPHSEAGRFHRGLSVVLAVLAIAFLAAVAVVRHEGGELVVEGAGMGVSGWLLWGWLRDLRHAPSGFPEVDLTRPIGTPPPGSASPAYRRWGFDGQSRGAGYGDRPHVDREERP